MAKKKKANGKQKEAEISKVALKEWLAREERIECNNLNAMEDETEANAVEDNMEADEDHAMPIDVNNEVSLEADVSVHDTLASQHVKKATRGPTKMKRLPSDAMSRVEVDFNAMAEPIGPGSVVLSSYLGPLVRGVVPFTLVDWRQLDDGRKIVLWESIQARFKLDEDWQKVSIFQQMGVIWRASKSRFVRQLIKAKNKEEILQLKPGNIDSMNEWRDFVKLKTSSAFKTRSEKYKAMKRKQMPHTCSRKGIARLTEDMKMQSDDPSSICRSKVWIKSRIRKNGEPINKDVGDVIFIHPHNFITGKIKRCESESQSSLPSNDALSQVLGQDKPGRLRAMGRGITLTKFILSQANDKKLNDCQNTISELKQTIRMLVNNLGIENRTDASTSETGISEKMHEKCDLLDCNGCDEIVVEGRVLSSDPNEFVHQFPLGPNAMKILIEFPKITDAYLWRTAATMTRVGEAKNMTVAWLADRVIVRTREKEKEDIVVKF